MSFKTASAQHAQCEVLFDLVEGPSGPTRVGRLLKGFEAGRLVLLREVAAEDAALLAPLIDTARCIAHPSLAKVLGVVHANGRLHIASEYVQGTSLVELRLAVAARPRPLDIAVSVRIIRDALLAAVAAHKLLTEAGGSDGCRYLFADTIWVAPFGETFVTEAGIASKLNPMAAGHLSMSATGFPLPGAESPYDDVFTAGVELWQLLTNDVYDEEAVSVLSPDVPHELRPLVMRALSASDQESFAGPQGMADALSALPAHLIADEEAVGACVTLLMRETLELRERKLAVFERESEGHHAEESTVFFRSTGFVGHEVPDSQDTVRPRSSGDQAPNVIVHEGARATSAWSEGISPQFDALSEELEVQTSMFRPSGIPAPHSPSPPDTTGAPDSSGEGDGPTTLFRGSSPAIALEDLSSRSLQDVVAQARDSHPGTQSPAPAGAEPELASASDQHVPGPDSMQRNSQEMVMWARAYWKNEPTVVSAPRAARPQILKASILGVVVLALLIGAWLLYQWRFGH